MKEAHNQPAFTARDAAKSLIRPYVERGDSLDSLASGQMGYSGPDYASQIGGAAIDPDGGVHLLGSRGMAVTRLQEVRVFARFTLEQLYREIKDEADPAKPKQGRLF